MKWIWSRYKIGFLSLVLPAVLIAIGLSFLGFLWEWSRSLSGWVSVGLFWQILFMAILLISPFLMGILISWQGFRKLILKLFSKVPVLSLFVDLFFNNINVEKTQKGNFHQEVMFKTDENTILIGTVWNEFVAPENLVEGPLADWLIIIIPTTPGAPTGPTVIRKKSEVVYTGRSLKDTMVSIASFCSKFDIDYTKFSKGKPQ